MLRKNLTPTSKLLDVCTDSQTETAITRLLELGVLACNVLSTLVHEGCGNPADRVCPHEMADA